MIFNHTIWQINLIFKTKPTLNIKIFQLVPINQKIKIWNNFPQIASVKITKFNKKLFLNKVKKMILKFQRKTMKIKKTN